MSLYWYTDKPIGKYRLKKPIPLDAEFESCEGWWMRFPFNDGDILADNDYMGEERAIKYIEQNLDLFREYLEEI